MTTVRRPTTQSSETQVLPRPFHYVPLPHTRPAPAPHARPHQIHPHMCNDSSIRGRTFSCYTVCLCCVVKWGAGIAWPLRMYVSDGDGLGDECDDDKDGDGRPNGADLCTLTQDGTNADADGDHIGQLNMFSVARGVSVRLFVCTNCSLFHPTVPMDFITHTHASRSPHAQLLTNCDVPPPSLVPPWPGHVCDNCPNTGNPRQEDVDKDGIGTTQQDDGQCGVPPTMSLPCAAF